MWCSPHLAANFGIFELRTFHGHQVKLRYTFYPFTLKVGSKYTSKHGWLNTSYKFGIYYVCAKPSQSLWNCAALLTISKLHFKRTTESNWNKLVFFYCSHEKLDCVTKLCLFKVYFETFIVWSVIWTGFLPNFVRYQSVDFKILSLVDIAHENQQNDFTFALSHLLKLCASWDHAIW